MKKKNFKKNFQLLDFMVYNRSFLVFLSFSGGILRGSRRERVLSKFVESECEKIDRLMELYIR